jgi:aryl-alcohol dehydrogenase-like predicted oxidoreductase
MRYTLFGPSGLRMSEYALGAGNFGTAWGTGADRDTARKMLERFAEAGGTAIDTADGYQVGESETLLGEFLGAERDRFVLATKYSNGPAAAHVSTTGNGRANMVRSVEASLRRLRTDRIDLYWVHHPDGVTPMEEILRGLDDLVRAGKVVHAGLSNFPAWRVSRAVALAEARGWTPPVGVQVEYSLVERTADREVLPMAHALNLGAALWSPLGGGLLTGKYRVSAAGRLTDWNRLVHTEDGGRKTAVLDAVLRVADAHGRSPAQVAMAWLRARADALGAVHVPVIGPRDLAQLEDYLAALELSLTPDQVAELDAVSAVPAGVPHEVGASVHDQVLGGDAGAFRPLARPVA